MFNNLLSALKRLDRLLEQAVAAAQAVYGSQAATDAYQGLYLTQNDVEQLLARTPGTPSFSVNGEVIEAFLADVASDVPPLTWLQQTFDLSTFDLAVILIALAPEVDLRYERLYSYLQDDITRKRPTVDLALNLLCPSAEIRLWRQAHFVPDAVLMRQNLLHLVADPHQVQPSQLAHYLKLDEQIVRWLLGQEGLDSRLTKFCQCVAPTVVLEALPLSQDIQQALRSLTVHARDAHQPLQLYFHGSRGVGKRQTAEAIAHSLGMDLLVGNLERLVNTKTDIEQILKLVFREAQLKQAVLYLDGLDCLRSTEQSSTYQFLLTILDKALGITILAGRQAWTPTLNGAIIPVPFLMPNFVQRRTCWQVNLAQANLKLSEPDLDAVSDRFRLTPDQIANAIATAHNQARWRAAQALPEKPLESPQISLNDLFTAARAQSGHDLTGLARKIQPRHHWHEIILPTEQLTLLRELCNQVKYHQIVCGEWGFDRKLSLGKGISVLFSGSPGTGKTMAAEVIANELQLDLYKIDLSQIVSKYIGETEKNLDRIFTIAENANAILLFDEADALFGKRSEVKDAHDRYANIEIAYLLQKMEEYEGITILTTNLRQNLDEAFIRRVRFIIEFPLPDADYRLQIWRGIWPKETPLAADVDLQRIAQQFQLVGGNIRNIALAAAFLAAGNGEKISMKHLLQATKREFQKMGRLVNEEEFVKLESRV